jgi:hypothetical protein
MVDKAGQVEVRMMGGVGGGKGVNGRELCKTILC